MVYKILKRTSFAICLMIIAMIFIGSASTAPVIGSLYDPNLDRTGYQEAMIGWTDLNGVKWGTPIRITNDSSTTDMGSATAPRDNQDRMAIDQDPSITQTSDGDMWIAWHSNKEDGNDEIYYIIHESSSWEWLAPTRLTDDPRPDKHPTIGQMQNGDVWIAWDRSISDNDSELYYTFTSDGGATWTDEVNITNSPNAIDQAPSITQTSGEEVWVSWATDRDSNPEIYTMYGVLPSTIVVDVRIDRDVCMLGEPVTVSITVTNNGPNTTLLFPTSQLADFDITDEIGQHIYQWSYDKLFSEEITEITINQRDTIELLNDTWNQVDDDGNPVTPGKYYIDGWVVNGLHNSRPEIHGERLELTVHSGPRNIKRDAICGLEVITPARKSVWFLINTSMWLINESLGDALWVNETYLDPNDTPIGRVFDAEMTAVILLGGVKRRDPTTEDAVNDVINKLTRADELIARAVVGAGENAMAKEYMDKAHEHLSNGEPVHAIGYFKLAWLHSTAQNDMP